MTTERLPLPTGVQADAIDFELLRDRRRRAALSVLAARDEPIGLDSLAAAVSAREAEWTSGERAAASSEPVRIQLHHVHLPKLADAGVVDYDPRTHTVVPAEMGDLAAVVEALEEPAD